MPPVIPDYQLLRSIGRGAYGEVWLARSVTGIFRAAKIVYRSSFEEARPFEREFAGIQRFEPISRSQENQISVLHVGRNEGQGYFYYVMELADDAGQNGVGLPQPALDPERYQPKTLKQVIARGRLTTPECLPVAVGLCRALAHLHRHGLIHRDVKPSNIIFINGQPKLADIGLVSSVDATRSFVGTEGYVPPEGPGTTSADLFSLGKVLYEAATGRPRQDYPLLAENLGGLADREGLLELNEVILKACAVNPAARYRSAEEMLSELLLIQAGKSVKRLHAMERRFKRVLPALATCALLALCIIVIQQIETRRIRQEARLEAEYRRRAQEQERKTLELLYAADLDRVHQAYAAGDFGRAEDLLSLHVPKPGEPDLRGFEWWYYSRAIQGQQELQFDGHSNAVKQVAFSEDGTLVLSAAFDGQIALWDWKTRACRATVLNPEAISSCALSHDGLRIFLRDEDGRFECRRLQNSQRLFGVEGHCLQIAESPAEELLAVSLGIDSGPEAAAPSRPPDTTRLLDARSGVELFALPDAGRVLRFSRDGRLLAIGKYDGSINIWDLKRRAVVARLHCNENRFDIGFSGDGRLLAVGEGDGVLTVWDLSNQQLHRTIQTRQSTLWQIAWSPDGRQLATAGSDQTVRVWDSSELKELRVFRGHRSEVWCLAFSPDGQRIVSGSKDQSVRIWNLAPRREELPLSSTVSFWQWPVFSADSRYLAAGQRNGVGVWQVGDGQQVLCFTNSTDPLAFSDDSRGVWVLSGAAIELRSLSTGACVRSLSATNADLGMVRAHDFWRRGQLLAIGYRDGRVGLWDLSCGAELRRWPAHPGNITALSFSPDGQQLLSTCEHDQTAKLWDAHTGRLRHELQGHKLGIFGAAFSPDGKLVATASPDDTCLLWNASTFETVGVLGRHRGGAFSVSFGRSGRSLVVGTGDRQVKLWSLAALREMSGFDSDPVVVFFAGFSPDEQNVATVSLDGAHNRCTLRLLRGNRF
jgi:WD40 repeat protein